MNGKRAIRRRDHGTSENFRCGEKQHKDRHRAPDYPPRHHSWFPYHGTAAEWVAGRAADFDPIPMMALGRKGSEWPKEEATTGSTRSMLLSSPRIRHWHRFRRSGLVRRRVVSRPGSRRGAAGGLHSHSNFPESAIHRSICGGVFDGVLAPQIARHLVNDRLHFGNLLGIKRLAASGFRELTLPL